MIAYVEGKLVHKEPAFVIIDTGGIGYQIKISLTTYGFLKDKSSCKLHTYLHIKDDAHTLYGFWEISEKIVFLDLISISGVGPGTGLMILSSMNAKDIQSAIVNEEVKTIQAVKGIGAKTAQRIILELKDKIKKDYTGMDGGKIAISSHNTVRNEALSALTTLGIQKNAAEKSISSILKKYDDQITVEELIKQALKSS